MSVAADVCSPHICLRKSCSHVLSIAYESHDQLRRLRPKFAHPRWICRVCNRSRAGRGCTEIRLRCSSATRDGRMHVWGLHTERSSLVGSGEFTSVPTISGQRLPPRIGTASRPSIPLNLPGCRALIVPVGKALTGPRREIHNARIVDC